MNERKQALDEALELMDRFMTHVCFTRSICGEPLCEAIHAVSALRNSECPHGNQRDECIDEA